MKSTDLNASPQGTPPRRGETRPAPPHGGQLHGAAGPPEICPEQWAIDTVLDRLKDWRPCGDGFAARCPGHADSDPSLSVHETAEGHVLLKCHAGCLTEDVVGEMGLTLAHLFTSEYARRFGRRRDGRTAPRSAESRPAGAPCIDYEKFGRVVADSQVGDDEAFMPLCRAAGVCVRACLEFGLGVAGERFVFPERDDRLRPVGVVYRRLDGTKRCHKGSTRGLTIPVVDRRFGGALYVTEGATDAMTLHSVKVRAVGRPAAGLSGGAFDWLASYLARHASGGVVVVGDNDPKGGDGRRVGRDAARGLAGRLAAAMPGGIPVRWALPRAGYKDVREQVAARDWERGLRLREAPQ